MWIHLSLLISLGMQIFEKHEQFGKLSDIAENAKQVEILFDLYPWRSAQLSPLLCWFSCPNLTLDSKCCLIITRRPIFGKHPTWRLHYSNHCPLQLFTCFTHKHPPPGHLLANDPRLEQFSRFCKSMQSIINLRKISLPLLWKLLSCCFYSSFIDLFCCSCQYVSQGSLTQGILFSEEFS